MDWKTELVKHLPDIFAAIVTVLVARVLPKVHEWLDAKAKESTAFKVVASAEHLAEVVAAKVMADMKEEVERAAADGVFSSEEKAQLKADFIREFKSALGSAGLDELKAVLGIAEGWFANYIEGVASKALSSPK